MTDAARDRLSAVLEMHPLETQVRAAELLSAGRSLLARLPTGAGKTLLAAAPFAAGILRPQQMVFMTPLRTLTSAQAAVLRAQLRPDVDAGPSTAWRVTEQTGTVAEDPQFLAPAVVCTFDQALSAALHIPYGLSARRRNMAAGAILPAYVVADELHLYPRDEALATLLWILRNRPSIPCCLMTATMTADLACRLANVLGLEAILELPPEDRRRLGLDRRERRVCWRDTPFTAAGIGERIDGELRTLVVVNTVDRAIGLGRDLRSLLPGHEVHVLHSRYYKEDRDRITMRALSALGRDGTDRPTVLVATQVVEAGLDISADLLFTDLAPANTLIQRWGRCARWGGRGEVIVSPPPDAGYPYASEAGGQDLMDRARAWLVEHAVGGGLAMDDGTEQAFVQNAHEADDRRWLDGLERALVTTASRVAGTVRSGEYVNAGMLIRSVEQRRLIVHGAPEAIRDPNAVQGFGLATGSLYSLAKRVGRDAPPATADEEIISFTLAEEPAWTLKVPVWPDQDERPNSRPDSVAGWRPVAGIADLQAASVVAIHPALVRYDPDEGLQLAPGEEPVPETFWARPAEQAGKGPWERYAYERETMEQHVERALRVLDGRPELWLRLAPLARDVDGWLAWPEGMLRCVVRAAIVCHDSGKLTSAWQDEIRRVQEANGRPYEPWLVHSDSSPGGAPHGPAKKMPPHARSGAAHARTLAERLDERVRTRAAPRPGSVLFSAIATHHNPTPRDLALRREEILDPAARQEMARLLYLHALPHDVSEVQEGEPLDAWLISLGALDRPSQIGEFFAFSLVIRLLRLADGWSQERTGSASPDGEKGETVDGGD